MSWDEPSEVYRDYCEICGKEFLNFDMFLTHRHVCDECKEKINQQNKREQKDELIYQS